MLGPARPRRACRYQDGLRWPASRASVRDGPQRDTGMRSHYQLPVATTWDIQPDAFDWQAFSETERNGVGMVTRRCFGT